MKKLWSLALSGLLVLTLGVPVIGAEGGEGGASFKQALFLYRDRAADNDTVVFVDTDLARWSKDRPYIPLYLSVGHQGRKNLTVKLDDISLTLPSGRTVKPAPFQDIYQSAYGKRLYEDRHYIERRTDWFFGNNFVNMQKIPALFYPEKHHDRAASGHADVEMSNRTWFQTLVYFPQEKAEPGLYTLRVRPEGGAETVVRFPLFEAQP